MDIVRLAQVFRFESGELLCGWRLDVVGGRDVGLLVPVAKI